MHRFYLPPSQAKSAALTLTDSEAHHLLDVLRAKPGDRVTVFDGEGQELTCTVAEAGKSSVTLQVVQRHRTPPLPYRLVLAQAVPKARSMDVILQKATELGVQQIVPLLSDRTVVQLEAGDFAAKLDRWRQITIEAAKQCGANWLPVVESPQRPDEFFRGARHTDLALIGSLQPDALQLPQILNDFTLDSKTRARSATIVIGPEGDFTPAELAAARSAGFRPLSLGPLVLRSETAAIYALSILAYELQQASSASSYS
jgi:16S rRNA (uracil1498-N3)-methyltransferase